MEGGQFLRHLLIATSFGGGVNLGRFDTRVGFGRRLRRHHHVLVTREGPTLLLLALRLWSAAFLHGR